MSNLSKLKQAKLEKNKFSASVLSKAMFKRNQKGFGLVAFFSGAFLVTFFAMMTVALLPLYIENFSVRSCITSLSQDSAILNKNEASIKSALLKKLLVSNVNSVSGNDILIEKGKTGVKINIAYNVQANFIKNIDFIVHFDEAKEVRL